MPMTVAAQMFTVRMHCKTPEDIAASIQRLAKIGYRAVQVSGIGKIDPKDLKKILDDNNIKAIATHTGIERCRDDVDGLIAELKTLDCPVTAVGYMGEEWRTPEKVGEFAKIMNTAGEKMKAQGLALGYHNHSFEFEKIDGKLLMDRIFEAADPKNVFAEIDTYWVQHGGADPSEWIGKFKGNLPLVHFKDFGILQNKQVYMPVGEGNLNWQRIIKACDDAGVKYCAVEQDNCNGMDEFEALTISLRNLQKMGLS